MKKAIRRLTEFLESVCSNYHLEYDFAYNESPDDTPHFHVKIWQFDSDKAKELSFRYISDSYHNDHLQIEVTEDSWEICREYSEHEKYFWIALLEWPDF